MSYTINTTPDGCIYYNASLQAGSQLANQRPIIAQFNQRLNSALVENAADYYMAITRFSVSSSNIPIFICPVQVGQANIQLTPYSIRLASPDRVWDSGEVFLIYNSPTTQPDTPYPSPPLLTQDFSTGYYNMYNVQQVITMINNALSTALNVLIAAGWPTAGASFSPPYVQYNQITTCFEMVGYFQYFDQYFATTSSLNIYMNTLLYPLLALQYVSFTSAPRTSGENYLLAMQSRAAFGGNLFTPSNATNPSPSPGAFILMPGDHRAIDLWSPLSKIIITSTSLPTRGEYVQPNVQYGQSYNPSAQVQTVSSKIVTDFQVDYYENPITSRNFIQYNVTGISNYRLISFEGGGEIRNFDMQVYWSDIYGNVYPLTLNAGTGVDLKFAFIKKAMCQSSE